MRFQGLKPFGTFVQHSEMQLQIPPPRTQSTKTNASTSSRLVPYNGMIATGNADMPSAGANGSKRISGCVAGSPISSKLSRVHPCQRCQKTNLRLINTFPASHNTGILRCSTISPHSASVTTKCSVQYGWSIISILRPSSHVCGSSTVWVSFTNMCLFIIAQTAYRSLQHFRLYGSKATFGYLIHSILQYTTQGKNAWGGGRRFLIKICLARRFSNLMLADNHAVSSLRFGIVCAGTCPRIANVKFIHQHKVSHTTVPCDDGIRNQPH